jgi:hypothetical protein
LKKAHEATNEAYTTYISRFGILFQGATSAVAFDGNEHGKTRKKGEPNLER